MSQAQAHGQPHVHAFNWHGEAVRLPRERPTLVKGSAGSFLPSSREQVRQISTKDGPLGFYSYNLETDPLFTFPHSAVCHVEVRFGAKRTSGSGFMVGPMTVLTAAHVVYKTEEGGFPDSIVVRAGLSFGDQYIGGAHRVKVASLNPAFYARRYRENDAAPHDWAALLLDYNEEPEILPWRALGTKTGWFGLRSVQEKDLGREPIFTSGYNGAGCQYLTRLTCRRLGSNGLRFEPSSNVREGSSGSPVYMTDEKQPGSRLACGLITGADQGGYDTALAFTAADLAQIESFLGKGWGKNNPNYPS